MRVEIWEENLIILPETDFEKDYLNKFSIGVTFHKFGSTMAADNLIGIKINQKEKEI